MVDANEFIKIRKLIANIMYHADVFKHICERYDSEQKGQVLSDSVLAIMGRLEKEYGNMDLDTAFAAGMITYNNLVTDIIATGREPMDDETSQATARTIVIKYLMTNKDKYDPTEVKTKLAELQKLSKDGGIEKALGVKKPEKPSLLKTKEVA